MPFLGFRHFIFHLLSVSRLLTCFAGLRYVFSCLGLQGIDIQSTAELATRAD